MLDALWAWVLDHPLAVIVVAILLYRFWQTRQPFPDTPNVQSVHSVTEWSQTLSQNKLVIAGRTSSPLPSLTIDFYATWCPPCRAAAPVYNQLAIQYKEKCKFVKINVDEAAEVARANGVTAMPTFKIFKEGKLVQEVQGWRKSEIEAMLEKETQAS
jgi:thioredoxin 1